jgi:hypothetical protein
MFKIEYNNILWTNKWWHTSIPVVDRAQEAQDQGGNSTLGKLFHKMKQNMKKKLWRRRSFVKTDKDGQAWLPDDPHIMETCMEIKDRPNSVHYKHGITWSISRPFSTTVSLMLLSAVSQCRPSVLDQSYRVCKSANLLFSPNMTCDFSFNKWHQHEFCQLSNWPNKML